MTAVIQITRAGPLTSIQDEGRLGMLKHGVSASGPMDRAAFGLAGHLAGGGRGAIECTAAGLEVVLLSGACHVGFAGGDFRVQHSGRTLDWPGDVALATGDSLSVTPGAWGNYGYLRFDQNLEIDPVMGSQATSSRAALGGLKGRTLRTGDVLALSGTSQKLAGAVPRSFSDGPIRVVWGLHAELFPHALRERFAVAQFAISSRLDRMGVRLKDDDGVFGAAANLSLVSDAIVPGDIQILGDGTPIVLMRDHQPTGGYPRIATVISADLDRFAQMRPGSAVSFLPVTVQHAHRLLRETLA